MLRCLDGAALITRAGARGTLPPTLDSMTNRSESCLDRLRNANPELWEFAVQIAIHHDDPATHAVAAIGFYKALVHLGVKEVRRCIQRLEKWRLKGQKIETPGRLLMHLLNEKARTVTEAKAYHHRFPLSIIGHALSLSHRCPPRERDVQERLFGPGLQLSHNVLWPWDLTFAPLLTKERRGCGPARGVKQWRWRARDEHGTVLDLVL